MILILFSVNVFAQPADLGDDEWVDLGKKTNIENWRSEVQQAHKEPPPIKPEAVTVPFETGLMHMLDDPQNRYKLAVVAMLTLAFVFRK